MVTHTLPNKAKNAIKIIHVYNFHGAWVFDDPSVGLDKEPFVAGADTLISKMLGNAASSNIVFSDAPFPGFELVVNKVDKEVQGESGTDYFCPQLNHNLWLCPALLKYFEFAPSSIYIQFT